MLAPDSKALPMSILISVPFSSRLKNKLDVSNFDKEFTNDPPELTPMTKEQKFFIMNLDQTEFQGFSFLNPEFIQHV